MPAFGTGINPALGQINYSPLFQGRVTGASAIGQGIADLGQGVGAAVKNYYEKKETKELVDAATSMVQDVITKDPYFAQSLGIRDPNDTKAINVAIKAFGGGDARKGVSAITGFIAERGQQEMARNRQLAEQEDIRRKMLAAQRLVSGGADPSTAALQVGLPPDQAQMFAAGIWQNRQTASQVSENIAKASLPSTDITFPSQADLEGRYPSDRYDYNFVPNPDGTVTVVGGKISPRAPSPSGDSEYTIDPKTGRTVARPGTEAFAKQQEAETKWNRSLVAQKTKAKNVLSVIDKAKSQANSWTAGLLGKTLSSVSGTPAYDLRANLDTILANLGFDQLQELRINSPTGGALGNVSVTELNALQSAFRNLSNSQTPQQLIENLDAVYLHYQRAIDAIEKESGTSGEGITNGMSDEDILNKYL